MTNAREVVRQRIGRLGERLIGKVADADAQVELSRKMSEHALETQRLEYARERLQTEQPEEAQAAQV